MPVYIEFVLQTLQKNPNEMILQEDDLAQHTDKDKSS